jgi:hypothetical protein
MSGLDPTSPHHREHHGGHPPSGPAPSLRELEREVQALLDDPHAPPRPSLPVPTMPAVARAQEVWNFPIPPSPASGSAAASERVLRDEVLKLRWALDHIRSQIAENRTVVAGVHGELRRVQDTLSELRPEAPKAEAPPEREAPVADPIPAPPPSEAASPPEESPRALSAAPVFFLGADGETVATQAFFTLGKGGGLEGFLKDTLDQWRRSGFRLESEVGTEGITLTLRGDPEGRHLKVLPSGMYVLKLSISELSRLGSLPALVSSKEWARSGGFKRAP